MKKFLSLTMIAVALIAFSCNKAEEGQELSGPKAKVTYTVAGPEGVATKAMGTIGSAYTLYYEVRLWDGATLGGKLAGEGLSGSKDVAADAWPVSVEFDLARNLQYKVLFWAQSKSAPAGLYTISEENGLKEVSVDYTKMVANNEDCDVFAGFDVIIPDGPTAANVTLERPLALLNLGTADAVQYHTSSGGLTVGNVSATVSGLLATTFNVAAGTAGAGAETEFTAAAAPIDAYEAHSLSVGDDEYNYLNAVYVLPAAGEGTLGVSYTIKDNNSANITSLAVTNVPVKSNYRTNIAGKLLTGATVYTVSVDQAFVGDKVKAVGPSFSTVAALNEYFETMADNADNGDINPEEVSLTAAADGNIIKLPKIAGNVVIRVNAVCDGTLTMKYADGATDAQKPANILLYVQKVTDLVVTTPESHVELLEGSWVTGTITEATSGSTFVVRKGAKVGTLNVQQGNANVAGEVETLNVPAGATADGEEPAAGNAVQVFLAKDAAVEQIVLASKADVVVEQPKDNIDASTTENKVEVVVKEAAAGSTATAQNGGDIYVRAEGACTVSANGAEEGNAENNSTVYVAPTTSTVEGTQSGAGEILGPADVTMYVAQIGDVKYASLVEAVAAVPTTNAETTITMIGDDAVENGITIPAEKNIILELAGFTVSGNTNSASTYALITNRGTLTIQDKTDTKKDGTGSGLLTTYITNADQQDVPGYASNTITNNGALTVKSGKIVNNGNGYACYAIDNQTNGSSYSPVVKIEGGRMEQMREYTYAVRMFCNSETNTNSVEITGGVINGGYGIWLQTPSANKASNASLTISGGEFISRDGGSYIGYYKSASRENISVNISGGKFTGDPNGLVIQGLDDGVAGYKEFSISGGVFNGIAAGGNLGKFITGGTFGNDPSDYVDKDYEACFDDETDVWNVVRKPDAAQVGDKTYTSLVEAFDAAQAGDEVKMVNEMHIAATITAPYGNKCGIKQDGEIFNGQDYSLYLTTGGDQYTIMTSGGTIKNLTVASGFRAIMVMYPQTDVYIDNVTSGPGVCYAINTGEQGNPEARIIATNSTFLGWCSYSLIASASFTNCKFGQGTYYTNTWGRLIKPYVTTTFTNCEFGYNCAEGDKYYLDLCALVPGQTIKMINCKVGDTVITAENIADLLDGSDETNSNYTFENSIFEIIEFE